MTGDKFTTQQVSQEFSSRRLGVKPAAAERIVDSEDPLELINTIADGIDDSVKVVDLDIVDQFENSGTTDGQDTSQEGEEAGTSSGELQTDIANTNSDDEVSESSDSPSIVEEQEEDSELGEGDEHVDNENSPSEEKGDRDADEAEDAFTVGGDIPDKSDRTQDSGEERATSGPIPESEEADAPSGDASKTLLLEEEKEDESPDGTRYIAGQDLVVGASPEERWPDAWDKSLLDDPLPESLPRDTDNRRISVSGDITGNSRTTGTVDDFRRLFRDRYKRIQEILQNGMPKTSTLNSLNDARRAGKTCAVIGMVNEVRKTKNGHDLIELEDTTGTFPVLFSEGYTDQPVKDQIERVIADEVIGIVGNVSDDNGILFGDELYFPDLPPMRVPNTASRDVKAVLLSDLHFGAVDFAADEWHKFVEWMRTAPDAEDVEYVLIAGDLVEGIGVYPGQEKELDVVDIYDQYVLCAEALKQLPDDVDIYTIMGNHDTVRLAEPQPVIKDTFKKPFADNVHFAGNPAMLDIEGVKFQLYHGMSLNPLTDRTPGLDIHEPTGAMELMLEKRHLAPMYGMNVRLAPEHEDYLVMDEVPDVLHTGHVHTFGIDSYKNVLMANTGCWQYQTDFQKKMNVEPDVGYAPIIDLSTMNVEVKRF